MLKITKNLLAKQEMKTIVRLLMKNLLHLHQIIN